MQGSLDETVRGAAALVRWRRSGMSAETRADRVAEIDRVKEIGKENHVLLGAQSRTLRADPGVVLAEAPGFVRLCRAQGCFAKRWPFR